MRSEPGSPTRRCWRRAELEHRRTVEDIIDFLDLAKYRDAIIAMLPYGVRKVVELGRALATEPQLLLLDEPSSGLSPEETEDKAFWITDIKEELDITVLMVEHDMNLVMDISDEIVVMNFGEKIAEGKPREIKDDPQVIKAYLGEEVDYSDL